MDIRKAFSKDGLLHVSYESSGTSYNIKSSETPKPGLNTAMDNLKGILYRNLEVFTPDKVNETYGDGIAYKDVKREVARQERLRMVQHFKAIGLSHSFSEQNGDTYRVLGMYETSSGSIPVSTCAMTKPPHGDDFWLSGNRPSEYPKYLTPEDMNAIDEFLAQVGDFITGEREQKELFDDAGDPTDDADNGSEDFTEDGEVVDHAADDEEFNDFDDGPMENPDDPPEISELPYEDPDPSVGEWDTGYSEEF